MSCRKKLGLFGSVVFPLMGYKQTSIQQIDRQAKYASKYV